VGYGRLLGLGSFLASLLAMAALHPSPVHWVQLAGVALLHLVAVWLSFTLPWRRWSPWALLAFPVTSLVALAGLTDAAPGLAGVLVGFFVLCFAYTGLFLPRHGGWALLLPALVTYFATLRTITPQLLVRTAFVAVAWLVLAGLLHRLQSRQVALIEQLQADNLTDPLTGLANRRGMDRFLARAVPGDELVVIDLDHFKRLNDEHGHAAGDEVLRAFGRLLAQQLRTRDRAARSGGEEIVVLLRGGVPGSGVRVTSRLRAALAAECPGVTFSAGLATVTAGCPVLGTLEDADRAMYAAKSAGRDQVWVAGTPGTGDAGVPAARPAVGTPVG